MPTHPFHVLERLLAHADDQAARKLIELGRTIIANAQKPEVWQRYVHAQCRKADQALQGEYTIDGILLLDNTRISSLSQLWDYRQRMAAVSGYLPQAKEAWLETDTPDGDLNERLVREMQTAAPAGVRIAGVAMKAAGDRISPVALCGLIDFGYRCANQQGAVEIIRKILGTDRKEARESLISAWNQAESDRDRAYIDFLRSTYRDFL
jgi:hypothetical protein